MKDCKFMRLLVIIGVFVTSSVQMVASQVTGGLWVPAYGPNGPNQMPNYFSGTNCRASGSGQISGAIESAYLKLNGEMVASYVHPWSEPFVNSVALKAMFDSSHFPDGTTVTVRLEINGYSSGPYVKTGSALVKNRAMFYEDPDPLATPDPSVVLDGLFSGTGYSRVLQNGGAWTKSAYFASMDGSNFVAFCGHGTPATHSTGDAGPSITSSDYENARQAQVGNPVPPVPPFNDGAPPVNVLYLLACNCGDEQNFMKSLWPYYMGWGGLYLENQAVLAYSVFTVLQEFSDHASVVGYALCGGRTVFKTQEYFEKYIRDNPDVLHCWDDYDHQNPTPSRRMKKLDFVAQFNPVEGGKARVVSVYTGTHSDPIGWFKQL